jgi:preprotein translocase, secG subunit
MVQNPKGGGLSSTFGGNTQVVGGVKKTGDFLERSTWTFATALAVLILIANTLIANNSNGVTGDSKLLDGSTPAAPINQLNQQAPANNNATQQVPATPATSSNTGN